MIRRASALLLCLLLVACTPELIPRPAPAAPTVPRATPTPLPINGAAVTSPALATIHMLDENDGWGISDTTILRTQDGGQTWYDVGPKHTGQLGYAADSSFLDTQRGWVLTPDPTDMLKGTLLKTSDGGANWQSIPVPFGGGDLHFLDTKNGWMMAGLGAAAGSMGIAVFRTDDG